MRWGASVYESGGKGPPGQWGGVVAKGLGCVWLSVCIWPVICPVAMYTASHMWGCSVRRRADRARHLWEASYMVLGRRYLLEDIHTSVYWDGLFRLDSVVKMLCRNCFWQVLEVYPRMII